VGDRVWGVGVTILTEKAQVLEIKTVPTPVFLQFIPHRLA